MSSGARRSEITKLGDFTSRQLPFLMYKYNYPSSAHVLGGLVFTASLPAAMECGFFYHGKKDYTDS